MLFCLASKLNLLMIFRLNICILFQIRGKDTTFVANQRAIAALSLSQNQGQQGISFKKVAHQIVLIKTVAAIFFQIPFCILSIFTFIKQKADKLIVILEKSSQQITSIHRLSPHILMSFHFIRARLRLSAT